MSSHLPTNDDALPHAGGRVTVFAGSKLGVLPAYRQAAHDLGGLLAAEGLDLIFGGTGGGLMQVVADAVKEAGGNVIGVLPPDLWPHLAYLCTERWEVKNLAERKLLMISKADAVLVLPGGVGTLDELWEVLTLVHLGQQHKPIGLVNTAGFFFPFLAEVDHLQEQGFVEGDPRQRLLVERDPAALLQALFQDNRWLFAPLPGLNAREREQPC